MDLVFFYKKKCTQIFYRTPFGYGICTLVYGRTFDLIKNSWDLGYATWYLYLVLLGPKRLRD